EGDRDVAALGPQDELRGEVLVDLLQVRRARGAEVPGVSDLGDLLQGVLVQAADDRASLVLHEGAFRGADADRVHADAALRRLVDDTQRRRILVVLAVGEEDDRSRREFAGGRRRGLRLRLRLVRLVVRIGVLPEASIARTIVPSRAGTCTFAAGRASARMSATNPRRKSTAGMWRRIPGPRPIASRTSERLA